MSAPLYSRMESERTSEDLQADRKPRNKKIKADLIFIHTVYCKKFPEETAQIKKIKFLQMAVCMMFSAFPRKKLPA